MKVIPMADHTSTMYSSVMFLMDVSERISKEAFKYILVPSMLVFLLAYALTLCVSNGDPLVYITIGALVCLYVVSYLSFCGYILYLISNDKDMYNLINEANEELVIYEVMVNGYTTDISDEDAVEYIESILKASDTYLEKEKLLKEYTGKCNIVKKFFLSRYVVSELTRRYDICWKKVTNDHIVDRIKDITK